MVSYLSQKIAAYIHNSEKDSDIEVLTYGYEVLLQETLSIAIALGTSILFGQLIPMMLSVFIHNIMRRIVGGVHAKTRTICMVSYFCFMYFIVIFSFMALPMPFILLLYGIDVILLILYAPADTEEMPITSGVGAKKVKSILLTTIIFIVAICILILTDMNYRYANSLILACSLVCLLTHPFIYHLYKCKKYRQKGT